jgi:hypothetical protein
MFVMAGIPAQAVQKSIAFPCGQPALTRLGMPNGICGWRFDFTGNPSSFSLTSAASVNFDVYGYRENGEVDFFRGGFGNCGDFPGSFSSDTESAIVVFALAEVNSMGQTSTCPGPKANVTFGFTWS